MKIRYGWISNSSSTSFLIKNLTNEPKTMLDFAKETLYLVDEHNKKYGYEIHTYDAYLKDAQEEYDNYIWKPNETIVCVFGDEHGTTMGAILDYMLRDDKNYTADSFEWNFHEYYR